MAECLHCGNFVTDEYARVLAPEHLASEGEVRACPDCTMVRENGGQIRRARSRQEGQTGEVAQPDRSLADD